MKLEYFFSWLSLADFLESTKIGGDNVAVNIFGGSLSLLLIDNINSK